MSTYSCRRHLSFRAVAECSLSAKNFIILLSGPTGVGKTALSLDLGERLKTEIVNADSMQIYRYMDIGTAKPTPEERIRIRHHLLDIVNPDEPFDAARYLEVASPVIDKLHQEDRIPLVVGGTGLYMKILMCGICEGAPTDPDVRQRLLIEEQEYGLQRLYEELSQVDPLVAARIHCNDRQRITRALEVFRLTRKPLSYWQEQHRFEEKRYRTVKVFVYRDRDELYRRINSRVHEMMEQGFLEEVQKLLHMGYGPELRAMQSLGYKQLVQHLLGEFALDAAVSNIQRDTRRYAKRQMTWFRGDPEFRWIHAQDLEKVIEYVEGMIRKSCFSSVEFS